MIHRHFLDEKINFTRENSFKLKNENWIFFSATDKARVVSRERSFHTRKLNNDRHLYLDIVLLYYVTEQSVYCFCCVCQNKFVYNMTNSIFILYLGGKYKSVNKNHYFSVTAEFKMIKILVNCCWGVVKKPFE